MVGRARLKVLEIECDRRVVKPAATFPSPVVGP